MVVKSKKNGGDPDRSPPRYSYFGDTKYYLRYLSNQLKNSRFQTTEFCGWNT